MNITLEKEKIVKQINEEDDVSLIEAIKDLLETGHHIQNATDDSLDRELEIAIIEAENEHGTPHEEFWAEVKTKYKL